MSAATDVGVSQDESSSTAEDDDMPAEEEKDKENSGCQLASSPAHRNVPLGALVLIALLAYRHRTRARRSHA